jgi:TPR repeat protein
MSTVNIETLTEKANNNDYTAAYNLGKIYLTGCEGVAQDYNKARGYLSVAANNGVVGANYYLGKMYYNGIGVAVDHAKAKEFFERSAQANNVFSNYYLGKIYYWGDGVEKNVSKASELKASILNRPLYINQDTDIENFYSIADFEGATQKYVNEIQASVQDEYKKLYGEEV